jgi:hypothetical protein
VTVRLLRNFYVRLQLIGSLQFSVAQFISTFTLQEMQSFNLWTTVYVDAVVVTVQNDDG